MSRVLLESAAVGTPVITHDFGLLGHLVRQEGLGIAVDCTKPDALRAALDQMADESLRASFAPRLEAFARIYAWDAFREADWMQRGGDELRLSRAALAMDGGGADDGS